jgi:cell division protein FtsQ
MQSLEKKRSDQTSSRFFYRWERLRLTPYFRRIIDYGIPLFLIVLIGLFYFSKAENVEILKVSWREFKENTKNRPEFLINFIKIKGANQPLVNEIRLLTGLDLPISSYDVNLHELQNKIELMNAVKNVNISIAENIIYIQVQPRIPAIYWLNTNGLELLDPDGVSMGIVESGRPNLDLPLIAGVGASIAIDEALFIYSNSNSFSNEILGLVRIGERRWNIILKNGRKIMLPADGLTKVYKNLIRENKVKKLLSVNFSLLDLRNPNRMMIRRQKDAKEAVEIKLRRLEEGEI